MANWNDAGTGTNWVGGRARHPYLDHDINESSPEPDYEMLFSPFNRDTTAYDSPNQDTPTYDPGEFSPLNQDSPTYDPEEFSPLNQDTPTYDPEEFSPLNQDTPTYDPEEFSPLNQDTPIYDPEEFNNTSTYDLFSPFSQDTYPEEFSPVHHDISDFDQDDFSPASQDAPSYDSDEYLKQGVVHYGDSDLSLSSNNDFENWDTSWRKDVTVSPGKGGDNNMLDDRLFNHSYQDSGLPALLKKKTRIQEVEQEKSTRQLSEAMKYGKVSVRLTNVLIQGEAGAGKTSTLCLLTNQPPPCVRNSTPLACPPMQFRANINFPIQRSPGKQTRKRILSSSLDAPAPKTIRSLSSGKIQLYENKWKHVDQKELLELIAIVATGIVNNALTGFSTNDRSLGADKSIVSASSTAASSVTKLDECSTVVADVHRKIVELMTKNRVGSTIVRDPGEILNSKWIYFIDSGGQPQFHSLLPHFVHSLSVALFTLRLSERLDAYPTVEYYEQGKPIASPFKSPHTTESTFKYLVQSLQSHTVNKEKPKLVLVGTFKDKMTTCLEDISEKNKKVHSLLSRFVDQLVYSNEWMDELIFPINAKTPDTEDLQVATLIQEAILEAPSRVIDIPIWWYVLEIVLQQVSIEANRMVLSKEECLEIAHQLKITEDALIEALKFFHNQYIFLYYPDIIPDVLFTSTQVLIDKLTELVKEAFRMREKYDPAATLRVSRSGKWQKFRDQGIITLEFLEHFPQHYVSGLFTASDLIKIFTKLLILTPFTLATKSQGTTNSIQYLMPSLLATLSTNEIEKYRISKDSSFPSPLLIEFPNGWPRAGVFCCLQVYLIQCLKWTIVKKNGVPILVTQNCVMLSPPNMSCLIVLIDSFSYIEVHMKVKFSLCKKICPIIRKNIILAIEKSCQVLRYGEDKLQSAFMCPCKNTLPAKHHPAELCRDGTLKCTVDETVFIEAEDKQMMWFEECSYYTQHMDFTSSKTPPTIDDILLKMDTNEEDLKAECSNRHIVKIAVEINQWENVAEFLGISELEKEDIKCGNSTRKSQRIQLLRMWKEKFSYKATYQWLVEAFHKCQLTDLAVYVCSLLHSTVD